MKLILALCYLSSAPLFSHEVYFSPSPDCENRIVKAIDEAKTEISVAVYSINNRKITGALEQAHARGIKLRILTDHVQAAQKSSTVTQMMKKGLNVRVHSKHKIEHNKFALFDGKLVSTGSFNWTGPAARSNSENCLFLDDVSVIGRYKDRFEQLWQMNTAEGSKARMDRILAKANQ